jgi:putative ABC transport system ATP-binding protein
VGLAHRANHLPTGLSGGEQQRVAIARALANHPEVIIADEPTGNLDSQNAADVMALLVGLRRDTGVTLIVATHNEEVARHATRRIRLRDGAIVSDTHQDPPSVVAPLIPPAEEPLRS